MVTRRRLLAGFGAISVLPLGKGESHSMDQRVSLVTLGVKDLRVSKRFYVEGFGWKPVFENKEIIFFQTGGMIFALFLLDHLAAELSADQTTFGRAPMTLAYNVRSKSEVQPLVERAAAAGAAILLPAREAPWGATRVISPIPMGLHGR